MPYARRRQASYKAKPYRRMAHRRRKVMTTNKVRRIIGAELKHTTIGQEGTVPSVDGAVITYTELIPQGNGVNQRGGDWIRGINIHGALKVEGGDEKSGKVVTVRCMILRWDLDATTAGPTIADIVQNPTAPGGQFNFANRGNFQILYTKVFNIVNDATNPFFQRLLKIYVRLGRLPKVLYNGAFPKKNQLYFLIFSDTADVGQVPKFRIDMSFRFTDS